MNIFVKQFYKVLLSAAMFLMAVAVNAQSHTDRIMLGGGLLYERGVDATISVEHETKNHNAWEYYLNGYVKYEDDPEAGHITQHSFWRSYRTWGGGVAYKPCVVRGRNHYGCLRLGASLGSDTHEFMGWCSPGYEHNFVLKNGFHIYFQIKSDLCINGKDLFRSGAVIGIKIPVNSR